MLDVRSSIWLIAFETNGYGEIVRGAGYFRLYSADRIIAVAAPQSSHVQSNGMDDDIEATQQDINVAVSDIWRRKRRRRSIPSQDPPPDAAAASSSSLSAATHCPQQRTV